MLQVLTHDKVVAIPNNTQGGFCGISRNQKAWQVRYKGTSYGTDQVRAPAPIKPLRLAHGAFSCFPSS